LEVFSQPCVRPVRAVRMTAGHNALRAYPGQSPDATTRWRMDCPNRGIDQLCIRCCSPSLHITRDARRDPIHNASATGSTWRPLLAIIAHAMLAILFEPAHSRSHFVSRLRIDCRDRLKVGGVMRHDVAGRASIGREQCGLVRMFRS